MRRFLTLAVVALAAPAARAQTAEVIEKTETLLFVLRLQDKETGGFKVEPTGKPSLRATSGAVRALHYLFPEDKKPFAPGKVRDFVLSCYDPKTGAFAEPGGKPDVAITAIGVMGAAELGIPREKYAKAMAYLKENAKTFEEMRIAAAGVEAFGVKECGFDLGPWIKAATDVQQKKESSARELGSAVAFKLRLGGTLTEKEQDAAVLALGLAQDDGWSAPGAAKSDIETTYRVMRALMLMNAKPKAPKAVRVFVDRHRNADGGYATKPGEASTMSGVYYAAAITKWLDAMEK